VLTVDEQETLAGLLRKLLVAFESERATPPEVVVAVPARSRVARPRSSAVAARR
jgi:hypothetical protein